MNRLLNGTVYTAPPIKGSRFRATVVVVDSLDEAMAQLAAVRAADPDATHHCWAFKLASGAVRCSDDGEPSGTAGRPILARLEGSEVVDALVVVTRWYGGTKLGAGGLVRAYGRTAGDALADCPMVPWVPMVSLVLEYDYADAGAVVVVGCEARVALGPEPAGVVVEPAIGIGQVDPGAGHLAGLELDARHHGDLPQ